MVHTFDTHLLPPGLPFPQQVTSYGSQCARGPVPPTGGLDSAFLPGLMLLGPHAESSNPRVRATFWTCPEMGHSGRPGPRVGRVNRAVCLFSLLPQDFFRRNVLNANDRDCRTICGLCGGGGRCPVNLEHVINSSDLYRSCGNLKSKQSDNTWECPYSIMSFLRALLTKIQAP